MKKLFIKTLILLSVSMVFISTLSLASENIEIDEILERRIARIKACTDRVISELRDQYSVNQETERKELKEKLNKLFYKLIVKSTEKSNFDIDLFISQLKTAQDHARRLNLIFKTKRLIIPSISFEFEFEHPRKPDNPPGMNED